MRARRLEGTGTLVAFTVAAQAAVGLVVARFVLARFFLLHVDHGRDVIRSLARPAPTVAFVLLAVGAAAAFFHLGRPSAARFALAGRKTSWLSREAVLVKVLAALLATDAYLSHFEKASPAGHMALAVAETVVGLVLVLAISKVYRLRTVPAWDTWRTPAAFFGTTLLLGTALLAGSLALTKPPVPHPVTKEGLLLALGIAIAALALLQAIVTGPTSRAAAQPPLARLHDALLFLGALLALAGTRPHGERMLVVASCAILVVAEALGRTLFYAAHRRVGL